MDIIRHLEIFSPDLHKEQIAIIGAGATGSALALQLCKLGVENVIIYDFDTIEGHNISNQLLYGVKDIGKAKARTLAAKICDMIGTKACRGIDIRVEKAMSSKHRIKARTVFMCVDSMRARSDIFNGCLHNNGYTELLVDMRINAWSGQAMIADLLDPQHDRLYQSTLYSDDVVDDSLGSCGVTLSVGATASLAASYGLWLWMNWLAKRDRDQWQWSFGINPPLFVKTSVQSMIEHLEETQESHSLLVC